jgi:hypothetical protein
MGATIDLGWTVGGGGIKVKGGGERGERWSYQETSNNGNAARKYSQVHREMARCRERSVLYGAAQQSGAVIFWVVVCFWARHGFTANTVFPRILGTRPWSPTLKVDLRHC